MKRTFNDPFTVSKPHLDLHGENQDSASFLIKVFVKDNIKLDNKELVIIHGKGKNILKNKTHQTLKETKEIKRYFIDPNNDGQTIVIIK